MGTGCNEQSNIIYYCHFSMPNDEQIRIVFHIHASASAANSIAHDTLNNLVLPITGSTISSFFFLRASALMLSSFGCGIA